MEENKNTLLRKSAADSARQVIVKAGSRLLMDRASIGKVVAGIAALRRAGKQVLLVTSGAVGTGMEMQKLTRRPHRLADKQALAAIGQSRLMAVYSAECGKYGFQMAQLLLTASDLRSRNRYLNVMNCIHALWEHDVLPVVNENDSVSVDELKFGDNDLLAGMLTSVTGAQLTILLTTVDGLCERGEDGSLGTRIPVVPRITEAIRRMAGGTDGNEISTGGMTSKILAAELATAGGASLWIADGREKNVMEKILAGEDTGTFFAPRARHLSGRQRWLRFFSRVSGSVTIDGGAVRAVRDSGKSLLPSGVRRVDGDFKRGDAVEIRDEAGSPFARGLVNFNADECRLIAGKRSSEVAVLLGSGAEEELIHRNNLTLLE